MRIVLTAVQIAGFDSRAERCLPRDVTARITQKETV